MNGRWDENIENAFGNSFEVCRRSSQPESNAASDVQSTRRVSKSPNPHKLNAGIDADQVLSQSELSTFFVDFKTNYLGRFRELRCRGGFHGLDRNYNEFSCEVDMTIEIAHSDPLNTSGE